MVLRRRGSDGFIEWIFGLLFFPLISFAFRHPDHAFFIVSQFWYLPCCPYLYMGSFSANTLCENRMPCH